MIAELKEAIKLLEEHANRGQVTAARTILDRILISLESQEARLREWEVREEIARGFITRPATFSDVMDVMDTIYLTDKKVTVISKLSDGREMRRKG